MDGALAREILHLVAARGAGGDHDRSRLLVADGRQQLALADRARDVEMLGGIAERARHAAAAGVEIDDGRTRKCAEQRLGRRQKPHRLLMAVAVEQNFGGPGFSRRFLTAVSANSSNSTHAAATASAFFARVAAKQRRRILADGRQAAGLAEHDLPARRPRADTALPHSARRASALPRADLSRFAGGRSNGASATPARTPAARSTSSAAMPISGS